MEDKRIQKRPGRTKTEKKSMQTQKHDHKIHNSQQMGIGQSNNEQ